MDPPFNIKTSFYTSEECKLTSRPNSRLLILIAMNNVDEYYSITLLLV